MLKFSQKYNFYSDNSQKNNVSLSIMVVLNSYIKDLLVLHDCVIVPSLGGFVANYKPASRSENGYFSPPRKRIAFNPQLKNNDGLLANTIAEIENISYDKATEKIASFVAMIEKELKAKGVYEIAPIGTFRKKDAEAMTFEPNELTNLFAIPTGITPFSMPELPKLAPVVPITEESKKSTIPILKRILVAGVSGVALLSLVLKQEKLSEVSFAGLLPTFTTTAVVEEIPMETKVAIEEVAPVVNIVEEQPKIEEITAPTYTMENKLYHVVVGCFAEKANAEVHGTKFEKDGLTSKTFPYSSQLTGVAVGSFDNIAEAQVLMNTLRENDKAPSAWILKRKF